MTTLSHKLVNSNFDDVQSFNMAIHTIVLIAWSIYVLLFTTRYIQQYPNDMPYVGIAQLKKLPIATQTYRLWFSNHNILVYFFIQTQTYTSALWLSLCCFWVQYIYKYCNNYWDQYFHIVSFDQMLAIKTQWIRNLVEFVWFAPDPNKYNNMDITIKEVYLVAVLDGLVKHMYQLRFGWVLVSAKGQHLAKSFGEYNGKESSLRAEVVEIL